MAPETKTTGKTTLAGRLHLSNVTVIATLLAFLFLSIGVSIAGSYFLGLHEGAVAARQAIHAAEVASEGRSRALCGALKQLAETRAAVKLHPIFEHVYADTGCVEITGHATP